MPDAASELREIIMAAVERQVNQMNVDQGVAFVPGAVLASNPFGALQEAGQEIEYGTGLIGGVTLVPFVLDISTLDGTDSLIGIFDPADLPNSEVYLLSTAVSGADGSAVATWPDLSGNGRNAVQATAGNKPTLRQTGGSISPNGTQMVEFDGNDDYMAGGLPLGGIANTLGYSIYFYIKEASLTTGGFNTQLLFASSNAELLTRTSIAAGYSADQKYGMRGTGSNRVVFGSTATGYQTVTGIYYPTAGVSGIFRCFVDGVQSGSDATDWNITLASGYTIGNTSGANVGFSGSIGAVLLFSEAHDESTRMAVEAWLTDYFEN